MAENRNARLRGMTAEEPAMALAELSGASGRYRTSISPVMPKMMA